ncbi:MAG: TolC family protein [Porphyromonas sp.]|nr:TolC family protein [Porphyromonas sp.]
MSKNRVYSLLTALLAPLLLLQAQDKATLPPTMSLSQCIDYALDHSPLLLPVEQRITLLEVTYSAARQSFLPSVAASIGENASFGRSQGKDGVYRDISSATTGFQIGGQVSLFEGGRKWYELKRSEAALETAGYIMSETFDQIQLQVTSSYISLLLAKQIALIAEENLSLSKTQLQQVQKQVELGKLPRSREIELESQIGQDQLNVAQTKADVERARKTLLLDMGVYDAERAAETTVFTETEPELLIQRLERQKPIVQDEEWVLPTTYLLQKDVEMATYDVKRAQALYYPTLSLSGGYSNNYYYNLNNQETFPNIPFADQIKQNGRSYVGITLQIPIYQQGQRQMQVRQQKLQQANLQSKLIQRRFEDERNITLAETDLQKAREQYTISQRNVELTTKALDIADKEYKAGRITTYEWDQAKNRRAQAQATYMQAIYNRLLRTINLTYFRTGEIPLYLAE